MKILALMLVGLCVFPAAARAAGGDEDALIHRGLELRRAGHDEAALGKLQQAYGLEDSPRAAAQLGFAEQAVGQWTKAEQHVGEALQTPHDPWIERNRAAIEQAQHTIRAHLARHPPLAAVAPPAFGPEAAAGSSLVVAPIAPPSDTGHKKVMLGLAVGGVGIAALLAGGVLALQRDSSTPAGTTTLSATTPSAAMTTSPATAPSMAVMAPAIPMDPKKKKAPEAALTAASSAAPASRAWAADTLLVVGSAAVLTGGALVIMGQKSQREARAVQTISLRPLLVAGSFGAALHLGF